MSSWEKFSRIVAEAKASKKLDPVGHEDADVDNDGDSDSSDSYLRRRRATVGAAIAADKKKKVEEAKQLDPVGKEDEDIDNDGDSDKSDKYLLNRRKVRSKIIQREEVEQIDEEPIVINGRTFNNGIEQTPSSNSSGSTRVGPARVGPKIVGPAKVGPAKVGPAIVGPKKVGPGPIGAAVNAVKGAFSKSIVPSNASDRAVQGLRSSASSGKMGGTFQALSNRRAQMDAVTQKNSYEPEGELVDEGKADKKLPEYERSAARLARYDNPSGALALGGGQQRSRRAEHEERRGVKKEEFVGENKEHEREMRKAAARERAEERREKGAKAAKSPGREGPSAGKSYADYQEISIKAHDKLTKKNKNVVGLVAKEEVEQLDEMPYQVYGSPDGKTEKKIGKLVKSKKYAHDRAEELADTHKETGGKYRVQKEENEIEEGMSMKDFKANRKKNERKEASADAEKRGHVEKTWGSGRKYSPDEAKSRREKMSDLDRSQRYRVANDPDSEHDDYPSNKTKDPKKLRKQKAMGELEERYIEEKAVSRAQQRFFGLVRAEQEGKIKNASPEVKSAAQSMTKKQAHDFAATKHEGLPNKKVEEELSLVQKIIEEVLNEAPKGTISGGKSKSKKYKAVAKQAKLAAAVNKAMKDDSDSEEISKQSEEKPKKVTKRGKSDPSALARRATVAGAAKVKAEREKTKRQRERQQYEKERRAEKANQKQKKLETAYKEKRIKSTQQQSDREESAKEQTRKEIKSAIQRGVGSIKTGYVSDKESAGKAADQMLSNIGSVAGGVLKTGKGIISAKMNERKRKKQEEKRKERHQKIRTEINKEEFSNWREEFIIEIDDQSVQNEKQKIIDVSKKKNKIEINPNMSEGCGCDEKDKEKEPLVKDMRELPTKVNLAKTKMRSAGVRNPIVMVGVKEDWQSVNRKDKTDGLSQKAVDAYRRENPGSKLQTAVTEKKPTGKRAKRRKSFCSRMRGMKDRLTSAETARDPDSRINKALRRWNCH